MSYSANSSLFELVSHKISMAVMHASYSSCCRMPTTIVSPAPGQMVICLLSRSRSTPIGSSSSATRMDSRAMTFLPFVLSARAPSLGHTGTLGPRALDSNLSSSLLGRCTSSLDISPSTSSTRKGTRVSVWFSRFGWIAMNSSPVL